MCPEPNARRTKTASGTSVGRGGVRPQAVALFWCALLGGCSLFSEVNAPRELPSEDSGSVSKVPDQGLDAGTVGDFGLDLDVGLDLAAPEDMPPDARSDRGEDMITADMRDMPEMQEPDGGDLGDADMIASPRCCPQPEVALEIEPLATYLYRDPRDSGEDPQPLDLDQAGFCPGDTLKVMPFGTWYQCAGGRCPSREFVAVFTTSAQLGAKSDRVRVQGALMTGLGAYVTPTAFDGSDPTDIPEDFLVPSAGVSAVVVPPSARFLIVAADDSRFDDNNAAMPVGVTVTCVP